MEDSNKRLEWGKTTWKLLSEIRTQSPLIQCITNFVSMDLMANTLLSAGASPAMVHSVEEIPDFTPRVSALCINVGTLSPDSLPAMITAAKLCSQLDIPWVLDPVAVSASAFRFKACVQLVIFKPTVIRGNASEIIALSSSYQSSASAAKGVDSTHDSMDAVEAAKLLAHISGSIVAVSGATDIVTDGYQVVGAHNGVPLMQKITATGCSVTALIAAFVAVDKSHALDAAVSALSVFGIAGELGMKMAKGPASLRMHLIDALYGLDEATLQSHVNITSLC
ncbi:hydroxyethylthiazole kinase-like [Vicia villosa]|uniref:hydroxyethylthiazole kinase-like n=1 Tax=Vicia villosa TaxID=3911 RepID=UPI00273ACEB6|nr:hydroxyethylthiazole kinase-like [Vicia villosa]XP_058724335.1 hydroxyethylthiazole kinase-like [Vicia villosa]XP_058760128.1 hydroxyethylthiazole kinase-like [Vicia villosa]XP_058760129.1 hydroxyethylthiazole kinase-like [Vicia villosa]